MKFKDCKQIIECSEEIIKEDEEICHSQFLDSESVICFDLRQK